MARNTIDILINADWRGKREADRAERDIKDIGQAADQSTGGVSKFDNVLAGLAGGALVLLSDHLFDAAGAFIEFGRESAEIAANARETTSLLEISLGPAYADFADEVERVADATGASALQFKDSVAPILAMTRSMGFAQDAAGDLAGDFGTLALDLNSFFNSSTAFEDIQSALAGSSETLQKYGIDVRETALQDAALRNGLIQTRDEYDRQVRALTILSEIQRQAADAVGDATRTADSDVNVQRRRESVILDLKAAIGEELLPIQRELNLATIEFVEKAGPALVETVSEAAVAFQLVSGAIDDVRGALALLPGVTGESNLGFIEALSAASPALSSFLRTQQIKELAEARREITASFVEGFGAETESLDDAIAAARRYEEEQAVAQQSLRLTTDRIVELELARRSETGFLESREIPAVKEQIRLDQEEAERKERLAQAIADVRAQREQEGGAFLTSLNDLSAAEQRAEELGEAFSLRDQGLLGETLDELIFRVGQEAGLAAPILATLAAETGNYTEAQILAALETAALQSKIEELGRRLSSEEGFGLLDARQELIDFQAELEEGRQSRLDAISDTKTLGDNLDGIEGDRTATVNVETEGVERLEEANDLFGQPQKKDMLLEVEGIEDLEAAQLAIDGITQPQEVDLPISLSGFDSTRRQLEELEQRRQTQLDIAISSREELGSVISELRDAEGQRRGELAISIFGQTELDTANRGIDDAEGEHQSDVFLVVSGLDDLRETDETLDRVDGQRRAEIQINVTGLGELQRAADLADQIANRRAQVAATAGAGATDTGSTDNGIPSSRTQTDRQAAGLPQ